MKHAIGITVHTGWGACVAVGGSVGSPEIVANQVIEILDDQERFCFHMAAEMDRSAAAAWIDRARKKAVANAKRALAAVIIPEVVACAIVAKEGEIGDLDDILASHPRIHTAEGSIATPSETPVRSRCTSCPLPRSTSPVWESSRRHPGDGTRSWPPSPPGPSCGARQKIL